MNPFSARQFFLLAILMTAGIAVALISSRVPPAPPSPMPLVDYARLNTYLIDVAGWYEITPNESLVATPFDFTIDGLKTLPDKIGRWTSAPYQLGPEVDQWFENPDLALSSIYRDERGHQVWFSVFGSRSSKSYVLFEHTPITSYPAAGWTLIENGIVPIPIGDRSIRVQKATLTMAQERRVVFYWYLWSDINRDPEQGVMTMRLHIPVISTDQDAFEAGVDFLRALFPQVVTWKRF
jgi:hypothetical protein